MCHESHVMVAKSPTFNSNQNVAILLMAVGFFIGRFPGDSWENIGVPKNQR
jgi:hypothetical protein